MSAQDSIRSALSCVSAQDRDVWVKVGMALKSEMGDAGFDLWDTWSQTGDSYRERDARAVWRSINTGGGVTIRTLFHEARTAGWEGSVNDTDFQVNPAALATRQAAREREAESKLQRQQRAAALAQEIWRSCAPCPSDHPYLERKRIAGSGASLYSGELMIAGMRCDGSLVIPVVDGEGQITSLEFIDGDGEKRYLPGGKLLGSYFLIGGAFTDDGKGPRYIAEGFATAATVTELTGQPCAVAFSKANLVPAAQAMRERFPEAYLIIAADNDCDKTDNVGVHAARKAALAANASIAIPVYEGRAVDFNDVYCLAGRETAAKPLWDAIKAPPLRIAENPTRALPDPLPPVRAFEPTLLPEVLQPWTEAYSDALQVPPEFIAVGAMVALGGVIGRQVGVSVKQSERWIERPILWGAIVGRPSSGKSPALRPVQRLLSNLESAGWDQYENELRDFEARLIVASAAKEQAKQTAKARIKAGDHHGAMAAAEAGVMDEREPQRARLVVNDVTVPKVGEILNANPRGLILFRDELAGWLASLDREGREGDRGFWLECWNGTGQYVSDTIGRGSIRIQAPAVSVLGGVQPGKLAEYVRGAVRGGFGDDGLMQRFGLAIYPDAPTGWEYRDREPDEAARIRVWSLFQRLNQLPLASLGAITDQYIDVPYLRLGEQAQGMFIEWQTSLMRRLRSGVEAPFLESHFGKYPALVARLALVIHLADGGEGHVGPEAMARSLGWTDYLESHARRIYAPITDGGLTAAHALLAKRKDLPSAFTARDVYRKAWAGLSDQEAVDKAIAWLEEYGHLKTAPSTESSSGGRPTTRWAWVML